MLDKPRKLTRSEKATIAKNRSKGIWSRSNDWLFVNGDGKGKGLKGNKTSKEVKGGV